jgi:hypothetical protein
MNLTLEPTYKQHLAWQILEDKETSDFVFGGGAGGGKSWLGCEWLITNCLRFPDTRYFIARKTLKNLKRTTLRTFFKVAKFHGLKRDIDYIYQEQAAVITFLKTESTIDLLEVKYNPSDPDYEDLGSSEYTSGWIEEAGEIEFDAYDTLKSRVGRQNNDKYGILGKILLTCNPKKNFLYRIFYLPFKKGKLQKGYRFLQSLVDDNPKNETGYRQNLLNIKDPIKKQRLLYGRWEYDDTEGVLIKYDNIIDLFTNTLDEDKEKWLTADIARFGEDKTVVKLWKGFEIYKVYVYRKQSTEITKTKIKEILADERIPYSHAVIDEDGVGGGVVDGLEGVNGFVANSKPLEENDKKVNYRNLKTQCAYHLAEKVNNHLMAVRPQIITELEDTTIERYKEHLTQELEQIKELNPDSDDKPKQIIPKNQVKDALGRSPDYGDCMIMRMLLELKKIQPENNNNQSIVIEEEKPLYPSIGI